MLLIIGAPPGACRRSVSPRGAESLKPRRLRGSPGLPSPPSEPVSPASSPAFSNTFRPACTGFQLEETFRALPLPLPKPPDPLARVSAELPQSPAQTKPPDPPPEKPNPSDPPPDPPDPPSDPPDLSSVTNRLSTNLTYLAPFIISLDLFSKSSKIPNSLMFALILEDRDDLHLLPEWAAQLHRRILDDASAPLFLASDSPGMNLYSPRLDRVSGVTSTIQTRRATVSQRSINGLILMGWNHCLCANGLWLLLHATMSFCAKPSIPIRILSPRFASTGSNNFLLCLGEIYSTFIPF